MQYQSDSYDVLKRYSCPNCMGLVNKSIKNNSNRPKPFVKYNVQCQHILVKDKIQSNDDNIRYTCQKCGIPIIRNAWDYQIHNRDDNTQCRQCGIRRKDHYTLHHIFKPYCGQSNMSPFDPTDRDVLGYDPLAFKYYPPGGLNEIDNRRKCGEKYWS